MKKTQAYGPPLPTGTWIIIHPFIHSVTMSRRRCHVTGAVRGVENQQKTKTGLALASGEPVFFLELINGSWKG